MAALGVTLLAQAPEIAQAPSQDVPAATFRAGVDAVQVDVFVTDERGMPVTGLTRDDFEVLENGRPQPIITFDAVDIPGPPLDADPPLAEPDVQSNERAEGRVYVFALDEVQPCNALRTRHFLRDFLDRYFGPDDVAAVVMLGRALVDAGQDFTGNRRLLLAAIDRFSGGFPGFDAPCRVPLKSDARQLTSSLRALTEMMARVEGRHKSMLFISEGIGYDMFDIIDYRGGVLTPTGADAHAAMSAATRSNLTIYTIDPAGLRPELQQLVNRSSLIALARATGGFHLGNSNNLPAAFERIFRESSTYYMIGFGSGYEKNDGRFVRIDVRVTRPGLRVHARDGYVAPTRDQRRAEARARTPRSPIGDAIASPLATRGLNMRVTAAPYKGSAKDAAVSVVVELDPSALALTERSGRFAGILEARFLATDAREKVYPESRLNAALSLRPDTYARVSTHGLRIVSQLDLPRGRYQLRVAAGSGVAAGSVVYDLEVPDFSGAPLALSGISLAALPAADVVTVRGERGAGGRPVRCRQPPCTAGAADVSGLALWSPEADGSGAHVLQGALPAAPTTVREFDRRQTVALFVEAYDNRRIRPDDPPSDIEIVASIRDAQGATRHAVSERRASTAERRPSGGHGFTAHLPLATLPPGAYALHVEARAGDDLATTAARSIPIRIR